MNREKEDLSKILNSAVLVFIGSVVASLSGLLEKVVIGRMLSADAYGEFSVGLAIFTIGSTIGVAGFQQGVPRYIARFDNKKDRRGAWVSGVIVSLCISLFITIFLLVFSTLLFPLLFESSRSKLLYYLFSLSIPIYVLFRIGVSAIRGYEVTLYKILSQDIAYPIIRISLIFVLIILGFGISATGIGYIISVSISVILVHIFLNKLIKIRGGYTLHIKKMVNFSAPLVLSTVMTILLTKTDTLMLGFFRSSYEVGIYNAAYPLAVSMSIVLGTVGYLYLPIASRLDNEEDESVSHIYQITTKWVFIIMFPIFTTLVSFPKEILTIIFGRNYAVGASALLILSIGFFSNAAVGRNRETLSALGATNYILVSNAVAYITNLFLNVVLIPSYGYEGAAIASGLSYVLLNIVVYYILKTKYNISPFTKNSVIIYTSSIGFILPVGILISEVIAVNLLSIAIYTIFIFVLSIIIIGVIGGYESDDILLIEFIEDSLGVNLKYIKNIISDD